jgi:hypothetical protein
MTSPPNVVSVESAVETLRDLAGRLDAVSVNSLLVGLRLTREIHAAEEAFAASTVGVLRRLDTSWVEIAGVLGVTRQTAWDRYRRAEGMLSPADQALLETIDARAPEYADVALEDGRIYTRVELQRLFSIRDATIKNGVFVVKTRGEIWLFVTEAKQADRVQFDDKLSGSELRWQGQLSGRTDDRIINHRAEANRILVFYRRSKSEHPGAGFRLEGEFEYLSSKGEKPTNFILKRAA